MGELPRPVVPDGPVRAFFDELHGLHHRAGWPSLRQMAKDVGCSHTTISAAFSGTTVPRWGLVELIVEALGGDLALFHARWLATGSKAEAVLGAPRQLPADVAAFTGRVSQLAELDRARAIVAVTGTGGVGKTALAVHWAHRMASGFPDGQLYLNLRGYGPDQPVQPADALETLLVAQGVERSAVPHGLDERAALYRTMLAGRRMLIVLDNARSVEQVRDLLPGTPDCRVVVTSRDMLAGLVARYGATRIDLDVLTPTESVDLLRQLLGPRIDADVARAQRLAGQCARLPLAIRIAAELAAARPSAPLSWLVEELDDEGRKLDLLAAGDDDETALRTVFSWSCRHLDGTDLAAFQLLGLHPGHHIKAGVAAALFDVDERAARRSLDTLARAHLVTEPRPGWFGMHDLLRAYAAEQVTVGDARDRLFDHYVDRARTADASWLDDERENLVAVAASSPPHALELSRCLAKHFDLRAYYRDGVTLHESAVRAARSLGDRAAEAGALNRLATAWMRVGAYPAATQRHQLALTVGRDVGAVDAEGDAHQGLGVVSWRLGRYADARTHLESALAIRRRIGDRPGEGAALYGLGTVRRQLGDYPAALAHQRSALDIYHDVGDRLGESRVLNNIGATLERMGRFTEAVEHCRRALELNREIGNRVGEAVAATNLAVAEARLGRHAEAVEHHEQALARYVEIGYRVGEADGRHGLGVVLWTMGLTDRAERELRAAVELARELGEVDVEIGALVDLGATLDGVEAAEVFEAALELAERTGDDYDAARALCGLSRLDIAKGGVEVAEERLRAALAVFDRLGVPESGEARDLLASLA